MKIFAYIYNDPARKTVTDLELDSFTIDKIYQDWRERNQLSQLIKDCQKEPPDCLLISHWQELGDSAAEIEEILDIFSALGVMVITTAQTDRKQPELVKLVSLIQDGQRRQRLRQGHARNRLKTLPPPGKAPYGYRRGKERYIIDRSTAPLVKDFVARFLLYGSLRGAVRYLEKKYGKKISVSTGRRWLTSPVYRGNLLYKGGDVIANTHMPIIDDEEAAQIDRLLKRNSKIPSRTASAPRSLAGLVICQQCQSGMTITRVTTHNRKREYLYLRPVNCSQSPKCSGIAYYEVLQETVERICQDLPQAVAKIQNPNSETIKDSLQAEINKKKEILAQLPILKEQDILDSETAALRSYKLRAEISQIQTKIAQLPPTNLPGIAKTVSLPQFWLDLSEAERRFYFREFIRRIEIVRQEAKQWQLKLVFIF